MADLNALIAQGAQFRAPPDPFAQYAQMQQLQQGEQANQLGQMKMQEYQRGLQEQNALRNVVSQPGFDPTNPSHQAQAYSVAPSLAPTFLEKSLLTRKTVADIGETQMKTSAGAFKLSTEQADKAITDIGALNTAEEAVASIDQKVTAGKLDPQKAAMLKDGIAKAPDFRTWQQQTLLGIMNAKDQMAATASLPIEKTDGQRKWTVENNPRLPNFGQPIGAAPTQMQATPGEVARNVIEQKRVGLEGQRVGMEGVRTQLAQEAGARQAAGQEMIPPKELQKREAAYPAATSAVKSIEDSTDNLIKDLQALRDHPGLGQITGIAAGRLPAVTSEGRAAQALYDKVVAKGGFQMLQDLRNASKTGGALGNISNQEGSQLKSAFAAIDRKQDAPDVRNAIDGAIANAQGSKARVREAYDTTYEYKTGARAAPTSGVDASNPLLR